MSAKKKKKKSQSTGRVDRGAVAGGLAASLVLIAWAFVYIGQEPSAGQTEAPSRPSTPTAAPNQGRPAPPPPPPVVEPAYKQEIRDAIALGKEGLDDYKKALDWNENVGGDPFRFANMVKEAGAKVNRAVLALESLKKDAKGDSAALQNIDQWVTYFDDRVPSHRK